MYDVDVWEVRIAMRQKIRHPKSYIGNLYNG